MKHSACQFSHALTRAPGPGVTLGLRDGNGPDPDLTEFAAEHAAYVTALRATGAIVVEEQALDCFPDSVFVEDPALCLLGQAVILRPGAPSRFGEREAARTALTGVFGADRVLDLPEGGYVDGGDILVTGREVLIGLSARTDRAGVDMLRPIVERLGLHLRMLQTPPHILHFKTGCGVVDEDTIFAVADLAPSLSGYKIIECPAGEEPAANLIRFNDTVFCAAGFPKTEAVLRAEGFTVCPLPVSQAALLDGGLSCMSLRFSL